MLKFIERYKLKESMPRTVEQLNEMLCSVSWGQPYKIIKGDKRGTYLTVSYLELDEFDQPTIYRNKGLSSTCSDLYRLIKNDCVFGKLTKVNFAAKQKLTNKFPKKYHKLVDRLLTELFVYDPHFDVNCNLLLPSEVEEGDFHDTFKPWSEVFAYLVYDNCTMAAELDRPNSTLSEFLEELFDTEFECGFVTALKLKEEVFSPQQKWNRNNPSKIKQSNKRYQEKNPNYQLTPDPELRSAIERERLPGESTSDLLDRLLKKSLS